jgi:hypothetical protein
LIQRDLIGFRERVRRASATEAHGHDAKKDIGQADVPEAARPIEIDIGFDRTVGATEDRNLGLHWVVGASAHVDDLQRGLTRMTSR